MEKPQPLLIFEYNGTARSGKGTIVKHLCQTYPNRVTAEETGLDYRTLTKSLLDSHLISEAMIPEQMTNQVNSLSQAELEKHVNHRAELIEKNGLNSLYNELINKLVANVSRAPRAREAVKGCFKSRVEKIRDDKRFEILLLDGRNLAPVIQSLAGTRMLLRTFVYCTTEEAARRECARAGIKPESPQGQAILASLTHRSQLDERRQHDAVKPDDNALDYWQAQSAGESVAAEAVKTSRQIYFDTTPFKNYPDSKSAMLEAADQMFKAALSVYKPTSCTVHGHFL